MSKQNDSFSIREMAEHVFSVLGATAILAFMASGTAAMCFPGVLVA